MTKYGHILDFIKTFFISNIFWCVCCWTQLPYCIYFIYCFIVSNVSWQILRKTFLKYGEIEQLSG